MTRSTLTTFAAAALTAACATTPAGPPPFDPVGSYTYTAYMEGQPLPGTMTITEGENGYEGTVLSDVFPPIAITSVVVDGQTGIIEAAGPAGPIIIEFVAAEAMIAGTWVMGDEGGEFTAIKIS